MQLQGEFGALKLIQNELKDLGIPQFSYAYKLVMQNASEAAEIMNRKELVKYIEEYLEILPNHYFQ